MRPSRQSDRDPFNVRRPVVYELNRQQRYLFQPLALLLHAYFRSWKITTDPASRRLLDSIKSPKIILVWHNRSMVMPEIFRRLFEPDKIHCLISPSRAAAWEVAFFRTFQLKAIRGSTSRRSVQAMLDMRRQLRAGNDVGISPDGPAGPRYAFQAGAIALARAAKVPLLLCHSDSAHACHLRTWDRHMVPTPFAHIRFVARAVFPEDIVWQLPNEAAAVVLRQRMLDLACLVNDG